MLNDNHIERATEVRSTKSRAKRSVYRVRLEEGILGSERLRDRLTLLGILLRAAHDTDIAES